MPTRGAISANNSPQPDVTTVLEGQALESLLSPYWGAGHKQDTHQIRRLIVTDRVVTAACRVPEYYISPTDPRFHLSVFNATAFLCQVGIAHALHLNGHTQKTVEVLMNDYSITLTRMLNDPDNVPVRMEIFGRSGITQPARRPRTFYRWRFDVGEGAWWGTITLSFPFAERDRS